MADKVLDVGVSALIVVLTLNIFFVAPMVWEYKEGLNMFSSKAYSQVVVFDSIHDTGLSGRVLVASGKCIFSVGAEYAWVQPNTPYLVKWHDGTGMDSPFPVCRLDSITAVG